MDVAAYIKVLIKFLNAKNEPEILHEEHDTQKRFWLENT